MGYLVSDVIFERQTHIDPRLEEVTLTHKKMARANGTAPTTFPFLDNVQLDFHFHEGPLRICNFEIHTLQRSKKWLVRGLVKFATAVARLVFPDLLG